MEQIIVMKFDEKCFENATTFQEIFEIFQTYEQYKKVAVVSALPGMIELLDDCANKANTCASYVSEINQIKRQHIDLVNSLMEDKVVVQQFLSDKFEHLEEILEDIEEYGISDSKLDIVLSFGEILSGYILNQFLISKGIKSEYVLGDSFLITDSKYNNALPIMNISVRKVRSLFIPLLKLNHLPVVTGFIGRNREGHLTTLGVGGTEFTAALISYCLKDETYDTKVIFWKDTDGVLNADPKITPARTIRQLSYAEAKEIAIGTKAFHPKCISPIQKRQISLEIRNSKNLRSPNFTIVQKDSTSYDKIIGITYREEVAMISAISESTVEIPGILGHIFAIMGNNEININMVSQTSSEINTMFVVNASDGETAKQVLSESEFFKEWFEIHIAYVSMLSVIGSGVNNPKNLGTIFNTFHSNGIPILALSQASNGLNITLLIKKEDLIKGIQTLHKEFRLDEAP